MWGGGAIYLMDGCVLRVQVLGEDWLQGAPVLRQCRAVPLVWWLIWPQANRGGWRLRLSTDASCFSALFLCPAIAGSTNMSSLVVMSKGTKFTQQSYKVSGEQWAGANACRQAGGHGRARQMTAAAVAPRPGHGSCASCSV